MDALKLDPAVLAAYTTIANTVSQQLASASASAAGAMNPEQLATDLGLVGAGFAARFTEAVAEHTQALSTAGQLVAAYGKVLRDYNEDTHTVDTDTAGAISQAGEALT
ncbi:hypothetical protein [Nocardia sp. NBC_01009]|uniref:hypothetical protein n=1 Tax=Nocardia sp. NBC_01009 TaxID=2975996 RepID=UPI0038656BD9|nr:hypothetical protein OHA42_33830 [Nocardia sp. NBC_01009]